MSLVLSSCNNKLRYPCWTAQPQVACGPWLACCFLEVATFSEELAAELESSGQQFHLFLGWKAWQIAIDPPTRVMFIEFIWIFDSLICLLLNDGSVDWKVRDLGRFWAPKSKGDMIHFTFRNCAPWVHQKKRVVPFCVDHSGFLFYVSDFMFLVSFSFTVTWP